MQDLLFHGHGDLRDYFKHVERAIKKEVEGFETNYLLNTSEEDLVAYLNDKYSLDPPILRPEDKFISSQSEVDYVKGISVTVSVPFSGDGRFFRYTPGTFTCNPPRGEVVGQEVRLTYIQIEYNAEELTKEITRKINDIQQYLGWVKRDINRFNSTLGPFIRDVIRQRKEKKMKDLDLVAKLGIPIKKREDTPKTYVVPTVQRKPNVARPVTTEKAYAPEPALELEEYENILSIMRNMALVMERSPHAYEKIKEEDLRFHFLFLLNGHYEGTATGETFNYQGKTDILIRFEGKNVFIAECKFWKGEKGLSETIDQLLRYTSWRDTKTAILLFNRRKNFSTVLKKIPGVVKSHSCFKRELEKKDETEFRYVFHQPDDPNRELILSILAFNVPAVEKVGSSQ